MEIYSSFMMADRVSWFATRLMKLDDCGGCNVVIGWAWCCFITNNGGRGAFQWVLCHSERNTSGEHGESIHPPIDRFHLPSGYD